jgi:hypothetical protein
VAGKKNRLKNVDSATDGGFAFLGGTLVGGDPHSKYNGIDFLEQHARGLFATSDPSMACRRWLFFSRVNY